MVHTVYALIIGGEIVNITVGNYDEVVDLASKIYGQPVTVVDVSRIPVWIGDTYDGSKFWRHGKEVEPIAEEEEE